MVLPKPWQRGQAPNGLIEAEKRRLGLGELHPARLALELFVEAQALARAAFSKITSPDFAVADFDRVHQRADADPGAIAMRSASTKSGLAKSISSSDSGVENSNVRPFWKRRLNPFLRSSKR